MRHLPCLLLVALLSGAVPAAAQMELLLQPDETADHILRCWPINRAIPVSDLDQAYAYQDKVVERLTGAWGEHAGYKAALTSDNLQRRFDADRPVLGVVFRNMLLRDRVILEEGFAIRPVVEADLMVVIKDAAINSATNHEEVLAALEGIHPMIEIGDLTFVEGAAINGDWLTAVNAGARNAVVGDPLIITDGDGTLADRLPLVQASVMDKQGNVVASGTADRIMGHPLNSVLWIRDEVIRRGGKLKPGDVLWLGSITDPVPLKPGDTYQVLYTGLKEYPVSIQVNARGMLPHHER